MASRTRLIFVPTAQHTGTWFVLNLLGRSADVDRVLTWGVLEGLQEYLDHGTYVVHAHVADDRMGKAAGLGGLATISMLSAVVPTVVPVRDPVLSLITRRNRHPTLQHHHIVDGFVRLAQLQHAFFLPIDLPAQRHENVSAMFEFLGIAPCDRSIVEQWRRVASTGRHELERAYAAGRLNEVEAAIGSAFGYLKDHEDVVRPFLERCGYPKLPWWS